MVNEYEKQDKITKADYELLLKLLNPFAPHITEEMNEQIGNKPICNSSWPKYDESKLVEDEFELVVQVNGKVRGKITVSSSLSEEEIKSVALNLENVVKYTEGKEIVKIIVIAKKLVNIVVK